MTVWLPISMPVAEFRHIRTDFDAEVEMWWQTSQDGRQRDSSTLERDVRHMHTRQFAE